jgi:hypothetical protein
MRELGKESYQFGNAIARRKYSEDGNIFEIHCVGGGDLQRKLREM